MDKSDWKSGIPDVRDGLTGKERAVLYCLQQTQWELNGGHVPAMMLYGRVVELVDISQEEFQAIVSRFTGPTGPPQVEN